MDLEKAHNFCMKHRDNVEASLCGCFYCSSNFMGSSIKEWIDDGQTALCPICGIDSVISVRDVPEIQNHGYKQAMYNRWFDADTLAKIIVQKQEKELK